MSTINELTIDVYANLTVSDDTAKRCLKLLEIWQEDNPDKYVEGQTGKDGKITYKICMR